MDRLMKLLYNRMLDNELNEKYANQIVDEMEKSTKPNVPLICAYQCVSEDGAEIR